MEYTSSSVCRIGKLTCMGCCGHDYTTRKEVQQGIRRNTNSLKKIKTKSIQSIRDWRDRSDKLRASGLCYNVIFFGKNNPGCPLHPKLNKGKDLRENHCEIEHLCRTAEHYNRWDEETRKEFIRFIKSKKLDWWTFSIGMDEGDLLKEFLDVM